MNFKYYPQIKSILLSLTNKKFTWDTLWLFISTFVLGISGILINVLIGRVYGTADLGVFSQAIAVYSILSMLGALGITESVLKQTPVLIKDPAKLSEMLLSAILVVASFSGIVTLLFYFVAMLFKSLYLYEVMESLKMLFIGFPLFCVNKVILSYLNGRRDILVYSVAQLVRWVLLLLATLIISVICHYPFKHVLLAFPVTEALLTVMLLLYIRKSVVVRVSLKKQWMRSHTSFGIKLVVAKLLAEARDKIDIIIAGIFLPAALVGMYAFASTAAKGLLILASSVQTNINPIIADLWERRQFVSLKKYLGLVEQVTLWITAFASACLLIVYPYLIKYFRLDMDIRYSVSIMAILLLGVISASPGAVIGAAFTMVGKPSMQLRITFLSFLTALGLILVLVPLFGVVGDAVAVSFSYLLLTVILKVSFNREVCKNETA